MKMMNDGHQQISTVSNDPLLVQNTVLHLLRTATSITGYSVTEICHQLKQFSDKQVKYVFISLIKLISLIDHRYSLDKLWNFFPVKVISIQPSMMIIIVPHIAIRISFCQIS